MAYICSGNRKKEYNCYTIFVEGGISTTNYLSTILTMKQEALDELYRDFRKVLDSMTDEDMENFWDEMGDYEAFGPTMDELFNCDVAYSFISAFETADSPGNDSINCMSGCDYSAAA